MNSNEVIGQTKNFVKNALEKEGSGHDWEHVRRVWINAIQLAEEEGADRFIVELAALLHDVDDWKITGKKPGAEPARAKQFLVSQNLAADIVEKVCHIINSIDYRGSIDMPKTKTLEAKIVYDADKLDAIGAIGIARCFTFGGNKNRPIFLSDIRPIENINEKQYTDLTRRENTAINHFFDKLLRLKENMNTASAKKEAEKRHQFMIHFLEEFFREQNLTSWLDFLNQWLKR